MTAPQELLRVADRVVWFQPPDETVQDPVFFLAHVMTYGMIEDIITVKKYFSDQDFKHALENAPAGVFDVRSWSYWNVKFGRTPVPPRPHRKCVTDEEAASFSEWPPLR